MLVEAAYDYVNGHKVSHMLNDKNIRNCKFAYKCTKKWNDLSQISGRIDNIRFSDECDQEVILCVTDAQLSRAIRQNKCVAVHKSKSYENTSGRSQASKRPVTTIGVPSDSMK